MLQTYPDQKLKAYIDSVLDIIGKAQEPDGYLYTARTQNPKHPHFWAGDKRWSMEEDLSHELYNLGHMVEGAVAHWQATGSRKFLDIAIRYADCVVKEVGPKAGQACVVPGHQIAEMALCKLYLATGNKKYLDEAKFFLDYRGKTKIQTEYSQSHKPVLEQDEAVGHAVRATYMYAGMADVAALTGDTAYIHAIDRIWDKVEADRGCISIERGPIVYCAEWPDNNFDIMSLLENQDPQFTEGKMAYDAFISKDYKNVLTLYKGQNLETLTENVQSLAFDKSGKLTTKDETLKLIPYFAWAHRGNGNMKVWLPQDVKAARPSVPATLASQAKVEFSSPVPAKSSITDGLVPADENDRSIPYCHWWPKKNTTEWITYTFPEAKEIKTSTVYWYDDQPWGGCKVPDSWKIYYQDEAGNWKEVTGADGYPTNRGVASTVNFDPVKTKAVKLELKQPETHSCGLFEWSVK